MPIFVWSLQVFIPSVFPDRFFDKYQLDKSELEAC